MPVDAITLNPYLGFDTLEPFAAGAGDAGRGLFVLVKTSNPGSGDLQDQLSRARTTCLRPRGAGARALRAGAGGPDDALVVARRRCRGDLARSGATACASCCRTRSFWCRATAPGRSRVGAVRGFVPGPAGREGGYRELFPRHPVRRGPAEAGSAKVWEEAIGHALDRAADELGQAVSSG